MMIKNDIPTKWDMIDHEHPAGLMHHSLFQSLKTALRRMFCRMSLGSRVSEPYLQLLAPWTASGHLAVGAAFHPGFLLAGARLRAALSPLPAQPVSLAHQELWRRFPNAP